MKNRDFLVLLALAWPVIASAEIVKCIDHGQVTYRNGSCNNKYVGTVPGTISAPPVQKIPAVAEPEITEPSVPEPVANAPIEEPAPIEEATVTVETTASFSVPLQNGSYFVSGTVGGIPTRFQIDTGASNTAVSKKIADQAGYFDSYCPKKVEAATANGVIAVCLVTIPVLTFGEFSVQNVEVIIMPNMQQEALLGMDVLQNYVIEQRARALKISQ